MGGRDEKSDFALVVMWARVKVVSACVYVEQGGRGGAVQCGAERCRLLPVGETEGRDGASETREITAKGRLVPRYTVPCQPAAADATVFNPRQKESQRGGSSPSGG